MAVEGRITFRSASAQCLPRAPQRAPPRVRRVNDSRHRDEAPCQVRLDPRALPGTVEFRGLLDQGRRARQGAAERDPASLPLWVGSGSRGDRVDRLSSPSARTPPSTSLRPRSHHPRPRRPNPTSPSRSASTSTRRRQGRPPRHLQLLLHDHRPGAAGQVLHESSGIRAGADDHYPRKK